MIHWKATCSLPCTFNNLLQDLDDLCVVDSEWNCLHKRSSKSGRRGTCTGVERTLIEPRGGCHQGFRRGLSQSCNRPAEKLVEAINRLVTTNVHCYVLPAEQVTVLREEHIHILLLQHRNGVRRGVHKIGLLKAQEQREEGKCARILNTPLRLF